jgi:heme-degrading monooxygenase HmoA
MDTPSVRGPESAEKRLDFEVLISDLSARFVNIPAGQVDREIEEALGRLLVFFDVDRCGLIEILQDLGEVHITHVALKGRKDALSIFRSVDWALKDAPGCIESSCSAGRAGDSEYLVQVAFWRSEAELAGYLRSESFIRMLAAMELSKAPPELRFHEILHTRGMEYIEELRRGK